MDNKANKYNIEEGQEANDISIKNLFWQHKKSWEESMKNGLSQDENGNYVPWMTYEAIDFLKKILYDSNHLIKKFLIMFFLLY